jgi:hypothetical protein
MINKAFRLVKLVVRGGVEPPAFRFSGASAGSLHVAGRGLIGDLAVETMARCCPVSLDRPRVSGNRARVGVQGTND